VTRLHGEVVHAVLVAKGLEQIPGRTAEAIRLRVVGEPILQGGKLILVEDRTLVQVRHRVPNHRVQGDLLAHIGE
jgi:alpha-D-ribose 1-methylphosphonate 5-phosphate C-P lyase